MVTLPTGTLLETYELQAVLGQGGGGISYRAFDRELEREVVLKEHFPSGLCHREPGTAEVVPTDAAAYELSLSSFCRGARILAALQHENVVKVHEIFSACGTAFLVMDYVEGTNLRDWAAQQPTPAAVSHLLGELLSALAYIHQSGVIHRDIKPSNILVCPGGKPVLIDFDTSMPGEPTHTPTLVGTPGYAAPEQFLPGAIPGPQADIYALGQSLSRVAAEANLRLPHRVQRSLRRACAEQVTDRFAAVAQWQRALAPGYRSYLLFSLAAALVAAGGAVCLYFLPAETALQPQPAATAPAPQDTAPQPQPAPTTPNLPEYHPIQLVHYDNQSKLIRYSEKAVLPPREEAFVKALLDLQEQYERETNVIYQEYISIENRGKAHSRAYYRNIYNAQKKLNDSVVALIDDFINKHYGGNDPYALWTAMLKEGVRETKLKQYEFFINHHATHPRHLIAYDENGSLVEPKKMNFVQSETDFVYTLLKYQQEFDRSLKKAQDDAAAANSPLSQQQLDSLTQELQLELNKKVLKKLDEYLYHSIDEEHPEYHYNQELRDNVLKHNIKQ